MSPIRMSFRSISSSLCKVARATRLPLDRHRLERCHRRQRPGAADLDQNIVQTRFDPLRFVLERDRPARRLRGESENLALRKGSRLSRPRHRSDKRNHGGRDRVRESRSKFLRPNRPATSVPLPGSPSFLSKRE